MKRKIFDMGSSKPHVTVMCPICDDFDMVMVDKKEHITPCACKCKYKMKKTKHGEIELTFSIPVN